MPAIDGIASGIDTSAIIRAITEASGAQRIPIAERVETLERRREGIAELSTRLQALADKLGELADPDTLVPLTASLTDESQFTVDTAQANIAGSFSIQVQALAQRSSHVTGGFATADTAGSLTHGTFQVSVDGVATDVVIDAANDSLQGLADSLNDVDGVQAYVVNTGDAVDPFRLVITAQDSGVTGGLSFTNSTGQAALDPVEAVAASDAHVTVNGLDVYSAENSLDSVIPGVTLNLTAVGASPVVLGLERNEAGLKERLGEFVAAFNEVKGYLRTQSVFNSDAGIRGRLVGEPTAHRLVDELSSMVSAQYTTGSALEALAQVGLKTENNGDLSLDEDVFTEAFSTRYDDVVNLLTDEDGPFSTIRTRIEDVYVDSDSGTLETRDDTLEGLITDANEQIERIEIRMEREEARLRQRFTAMELAINASNSTSQYLVALLPNTGLLGS